MVLVTGDCHGNFARFEQKHFSEQANMTKDDTVIITGDFGGVWFGDSRDDETLDWLERLPFTLVFVCGNHENYDALARYPVAEWRGGKVHRVRPHVLHLMRGQIFELEGCRFFTMGGAKSHDIEDGILEPDAPNFTPRISGLVKLKDGDFTYKLSILKSCEGNPDAPQSFFFDYTPVDGLGHFIHTYKCDGAPRIPSFEGEPKPVKIEGDIDTFTNDLWTNLNEDNKVSLFTRFINLKTGKIETRIVNKNK